MHTKCKECSSVAIEINGKAVTDFSSEALGFNYGKPPTYLTNTFGTLLAYVCKK